MRRTGRAALVVMTAVAPRRWIAVGVAALAVAALAATTAFLVRDGGESSDDSAGERRASQLEAQRLTREARRLHLQGRITFAVPREGTPMRVLIVTMNADGSGLGRIGPRTAESLDIDGLAGTPDGSRIAFSEGSDIYSMDSHGRDIWRISHLEASSYPAWSPDGTKVAFGGKGSCKEVNGEVVTPCPQPGDGVYVANANGTGERMITPTDDGFDAPSWSPDGTQLVFSTLGDGYGHLWVVNSDGSGRVLLGSGSTADQQPAWSPDGGLIASICGPFEGGALCIQHPDGTHRRKLVSLAATSLAWSPDGRWIVFLAAGNDDESRDGLWVIRRDGTGLTQIVPWREFVPRVGWIVPEVVFTQPVWTSS